jgi:hypothetical protein
MKIAADGLAGIECIIRHSDERPNQDRELVEFLKKHRAVK